MKKIIYSILLCSLSVVANLSQAQSTNDNGTIIRLNQNVNWDDDNLEIDPTSTGEQGNCIYGIITEQGVLTIDAENYCSNAYVIIYKDEDLINRSFAIDPLFTISLSPYGTGNYTIVLITDTGECYEGSFVL